MKIRHQLVKQYGASSQQAKAIALLLFLLQVRKLSTIRKFNYNTIAKISGIHHATARKRIAALREIGLARITNDNTLILLSPKSKHGPRNINLAFFERREKPKTVRDYERIISIVIVTQPIREKEHVRNVIRKRNNPGSLKELKIAKKQCRKLGDENIREYVEYGISYETLARKAKCSRTQTAKIIKDACGKGYITKWTEKETFKANMNLVGNLKEYLSYIEDNFPNAYDYYYVANNILYLIKVHANRYAINNLD